MTDILIRAIRAKNIAEVENLLQCGADINAAGVRGVTPLLSAALTGSLELIRLLIDNGADVNATSDAGFTPLMNAVNPLTVSRDKINIIRLLIDSGADVSAVNCEGWTALRMAEVRNQGDIEAVLRDASAIQCHTTASGNQQRMVAQATPYVIRRRVQP